jgi:Short C-terminal domain
VIARRGNRASTLNLDSADATVVPSLGVTIRNGAVFKYRRRKNPGRDNAPPLGELAGAHAAVLTDRRVRRSDVVAAALLGLWSLLALGDGGPAGTAIVIFADGTTFENPLTDESALQAARSDAALFNALAAAAGPPPPDTQPPAPRLAADLALLAQLHRSGTLSDAEFQTAKAKLLAP